MSGEGAGPHGREGAGLVRAAAVAAALALAIPGPAAAQQAADARAEGGARPRTASIAPYLAADHWVFDALRRLEALGLLGRYDPAVPGVDRIQASRLLTDGLAEAASRAPELVPQLEGYAERFAREYPVAAARAAGEGGAGWRRGGGVVGAGYGADDAAMLTTVGTPPLVEQPWEPERPAELAEGRGDPLGFAMLSGYAGDRMAAEIGVVARGEDVRLTETQAVGRLGPVTGWAGRRRPRIGYGEGGLMVSGAVPMDGGGVAVSPFRLPGFLGGIGTIGVATTLGKLQYSAPYEDPWLWLFRATVRPHPRLMVGLNRSAMAVAVEGGLGKRLQQIAYIAIGKHMDDPNDNWRDNQMGSVDVRYRPPLGPLPVTAYIEWGFDDSAGSWFDVPGIVGGLYLGAVPGIPQLAAGVEATHFAERCCGNIWWYRHSGFSGGWSDERRPLGHPLGGHGSEWAGTVDATLLEGRALLAARLYRRDRGDENLFAPTFEGSSTGGAVELSALLGRRMELTLRGEHEQGEDDWSRSGGQVRIGVVF